MVFVFPFPPPEIQLARLAHVWVVNMDQRVHDWKNVTRDKVKFDRRIKVNRAGTNTVDRMTQYLMDGVWLNSVRQRVKDREIRQLAAKVSYMGGTAKRFNGTAKSLALYVAARSVALDQLARVTGVPR
jgi:hypothetical protein